ncbi:MAG TPA: hypothetical protein VEJ63_19305 [Planctomycetota bacterium]|nr:hypothetical protein [Planctomycetota bacterium]
MSDALYAGFGRASMWGHFPTEKTLADELDVRTLAVRGDGPPFIMAVADLGLLWPERALRIRDSVSRRTGVPVERIGIFTTQNHCAVSVNRDEFPEEALHRVFSNACDDAVKALTQVHVARVAVRPNPALNLWRRVHVPEFGAFTFWFGYKIDGAKADVHHLVKSALRSLRDGHPYQYRCLTVKAPSDYTPPEVDWDVPSPLYAEPAPDELVQALFFRTPAGKPVGSLLRFPTHPATANVAGHTYLSGDYPAYARRRAQAAFGGASVFMTGPCGDSCPFTGAKSLELSESLGTAIANEALKALPRANWETSGKVDACSPEAELLVRPDYPASKEEAQATADALAAEIKAKCATAPLPELKRLSDRYELNLYVAGRHFHNWTGLDTDNLAGKSVKTPLFGARIGSTAIVGWPSEPFNGYSARLRQETLGDAVITCEEANGYLGYLPTRSEIPHGSYGINACMFAPDTEDRLIAGGKKILTELKML